MLSKKLEDPGKNNVYIFSDISSLLEFCKNKYREVWIIGGAEIYKQFLDLNLVDKIYQHTSIKFWDCHWTNVGYIKYRGRNKLVCIDTGEESFQGYANAWGYEEPGPRCPYCNTYACECSTIYTE